MSKGIKDKTFGGDFPEKIRKIILKNKVVRVAGVVLAAWVVSTVLFFGGDANNQYNNKNLDNETKMEQSINDEKVSENEKSSDNEVYVDENGNSYEADTDGVKLDSDPEKTDNADANTQTSDDVQQDNNTEENKGFFKSTFEKIKDVFTGKDNKQNNDNANTDIDEEQENTKTTENEATSENVSEINENVSETSVENSTDASSEITSDSATENAEQEITQKTNKTKVSGSIGTSVAVGQEATKATMSGGVTVEKGNFISDNEVYASKTFSYNPNLEGNYGVGVSSTNLFKLKGDQVTGFTAYADTDFGHTNGINDYKVGVMGHYGVPVNDSTYFAGSAGAEIQNGKPTFLVAGKFTFGGNSENNTANFDRPGSESDFDLAKKANTGGSSTTPDIPDNTQQDHNTPQDPQSPVFPEQER